MLKTISRSPKYKSKSRLRTGFSLNPILQSTPASHTFLKKQDTAIYPKQKLSYTLGGYETHFGIRGRPKTHQLEVKKARNLSIQNQVG